MLKQVQEVVIGPVNFSYAFIFKNFQGCYQWRQDANRHGIQKCQHRFDIGWSHMNCWTGAKSYDDSSSNTSPKMRSLGIGLGAAGRLQTHAFSDHGSLSRPGFSGKISEDHI